MRFYGILCAMVALALLLTPAIAIKGQKGQEKNNAAVVHSEQTTAAETEQQITEAVTTDGE